MGNTLRISPNSIFGNHKTFLSSEAFSFIVAKAIRDNYQGEQMIKIADSVIKFLASETKNAKGIKLKDTIEKGDFENAQDFFENDDVIKVIFGEIQEELLEVVGNFGNFIEFIFNELKRIKLEQAIDNTKGGIEEIL